MKKLIFSITLLLGCISMYSQNLIIENRSLSKIHIRVWMNSNLIHDHIMNDGDDLTVKMKGDVLLQFKQLEDVCLPDVKIPEGYVKDGQTYEDVIPNVWYDRKISIDDKPWYYKILNYNWHLRAIPNKCKPPRA